MPVRGHRSIEQPPNAPALGFPSNAMAVMVESVARPLAEAPEDVAALVKHWQGLCGARKYPARRDIDPLQLRPYLGYISIIEVRDNPLAFIYRLFGSGLVEYLRHDPTGKSVLELPPVELGQCIFRQLQETIQAGEPSFFRTEVSYGSPRRRSGAARLVLPLSEDGEVINRLVTYTRFDAAPPDFWLRLSRQTNRRR